MRMRFVVVVGVLLLAARPAFAQMMSGGGMSSGGMTRQQFVQGYYRNVLGRMPSAADSAAWQAFLAANPGASGGRLMTHAFFDGSEYRALAVTPWMEVTAMYRALLGRDPSSADQAAWVEDMLGRWMDPTVDGFTGSAEFRSRVPDPRDTRTVSALATRMYREALGRMPTADEVDAWTNGVVTSADVATGVRAIMRSTEYLATPRTFEQHVSVMYRAILGRDPASDEVAPWANFMSAQMASIEDEFTGSPEFAARCASLVD